MKDQFCYLLRVRYSECDAQQVVFNAKYVEYIDIAVGEFFRALWGDYKNLLEAGMDMQVVNVTVDWKAPAHYDEVLAISIEQQKIGNTSFTLQIGFFNYESKQQIASAQVTNVLVSAKEHQKMKIPADLKTKLAIGAPGVLVNHAGV